MASQFEFIAIERASVRKALRALESVKKAVRNRAMKKAAELGGTIMLAEIRSRAPVRRSGSRSGGTNRKAGLLRSSIGMRVRLFRGKEARAQIGPSKEAFYGLFVEFGTVHAAARPFMRPAFDAKKKQAADKIIRFYGEFIERIVRRRGG